MADYHFTEQHDYERGFSQIYASRIAPELEKLEVERLKLVARRKLWTRICVAAAVIVAVLFLIFGTWMMLLIPIVGCIIAVVLVRSIGGRKLNEGVAELVGPLVCDFLGGMEYERKPDHSFLPVDELLDLQILPRSYTKLSMEDAVTGIWRDIPFRLVQMHLTRRTSSGTGKNRRTRTVTLFNGLVMEVLTPVAMPTTVFTSEMGDIFNKLREWTSRIGNLERVEFPMAEFEEKYRVYSEHPAALKERLTPDFGITLLEIAGEHDRSNKHMAAAFRDNRFYLAFRPGHDFMKFDAVRRPLSEFESQVHDAMADLMIPRRIIDKLTG